MAFVASGQLSPSHYKAIAALLEHNRLPEASKACGVPVRTLKRWSALPAFRAELAKQGGILLEDARRVLQIGAIDAAEALVDLAKGARRARAATQIRAANAVLNHVVRLVEVCDLQQRVAELEEAIGKPGPPPAPSAPVPDEDDGD
ncbi:MAG TPA: hypothetical protein VFI42_12940 [Thermomicrobiaceae bacterium]|nr:hypothetical protein [Thermomicrobiaceae bacterium]